MGYDLHITRAKRWTESKRRSIAAEEWLNLVENDPELQLARENGPYFSLWKPAKARKAGAWLNWSGGEIYTKNPDTSSRALSREIV